MKILGLILALRSSQNLPGRHLRTLLGKPVIAHTFGHARSARSLDRVVVSSDCRDVQSLARADRFETIDRPAELATSEASVQHALLHALGAVESRGGYRADAVVLLQGSVAVRQGTMIDDCVAKLVATGCDSVRTFTPVGKRHPQRMAGLGGEGGDEVIPEFPGSSEQAELPELFLHDGGCLAVTRRSLLRGRDNPADRHAFLGSDRRGLEVASGATVAIDEERDLWLAEATLRAAGHDADAVRLAA